MTESIHNQKYTEAQSQLLSYWRRLGVKGSLPKRSAFDPGHVLSQLRHLAMLEFTGTGRVECRLDNLRLQSVFPKEAAVNIWSLGLDAVLADQRPITGHRKLSEGIHHWMRLPFADECSQGMLILCHDEVIKERDCNSYNSMHQGGLSSCHAQLAA